MGARVRWVISAAVCGGLAGMWLGHRRNAAATASAVQNAEMAKVHATILEQRLAERKQKHEDLIRELLAASNMLAEAVSDLDAERRANEPLRQEIEKRIASEIALKAEIERKTKELADTAALLQVKADEAAKLRGEAQSLAVQLAGSESARKSLAESEAALRQELAAARKQNADIAAQLNKERESGRALEEQLGAVREELGKARSEAQRMEKELAETRSKLEELLSKEVKEQAAPVTGESVPP